MENLNLYAKSIGAREEVFAWLNTTGKKAVTDNKITESELEHVIDFLCSGAAPRRLLKMSFTDAKRKTKEWSTANQKKGRNLVDSEQDIETIHDFLDGNKIVRLLTNKACKREGFLMGHCVGGYTPSEQVHIYSYRDKKNMPHATFEVQKQSNQIVQIKGKGNGEIHPKYIHPILAFLNSIGLQIRPNDMLNLGYYHVSREQFEIIKNIAGYEKQICIISGEAYAF